MTNLWNSLTEDILTAPSLITFENRLHWQNFSFKIEFNATNKYLKPEGVIIV